MEGFFSESELRVLKAPTYLTPRCGQCRLDLTCQSPKMKVAGNGRASVLVVGEAPGETEDRRGIPFVGESGDLLRRAVRRAGKDLGEDTWVTNSLICRPPRNRIPSTKNIDYCRPNVVSAVQRLRPHVILLLGSVPVRSVLGHLWKDDPGGVTRWAGMRIPCQRWNCWICPTWHPSHLLRSKDRQGNEDPVLMAEFEEHVRQAFALSSRPPWRTVPDYKAQVEVVLSDEEAASCLKRYTGGTISFDYETDRLKPDHADARIVCCSVCWEGQETVAFPWQGQAIQAMTRILKDPGVRKIGYNLKFEHRWTWRKLGGQVRSWCFDGMLGAHCLDSRRGVTGLKFQAFARCGQEDYASHVSPFFEAAGGNTPNRIKEVSLENLLVYCGTDSLLEYLVGMRQAKQLGVEL